MDKQIANFMYICRYLDRLSLTRAPVVHLNFRARSTFLVPGCTVPCSMDRTIRCNKVDAVRPYAS